MKHPSLLTQQAVDPILETARRNLAYEGALYPMLFVQFKDSQSILLPLELPDDPEAKRDYFAELGSLVRRNCRGGLGATLYLGEGWLVDGRSAVDAAKVAPGAPWARHPCRQESIAVVGRNAQNTRHTFVVQPFGRDPQGKPVWQPIANAVYNQPPAQGVRMDGLLDWFFVGAADKIEVPF
jgi:hypothetical protein